MRERRVNKRRDPEGLTNFWLVCPGHGSLPEDREGFGPFRGLTDRQTPPCLPVQHLVGTLHLEASLHLPGRKGDLGGPKEGRL